MSKFDHRFDLTDGLACDERGLFVGDVPLLERAGRSEGRGQWRVRALGELDRELSERFGLPVDCNSKLAGLLAVAQALDRGDFTRAQIAALHLRIPNPPDLAKSAPSPQEVMALASRLQFCGLLKAGWNPAQHPRWPAESPDGVGGRFAPAGSGEDATTSPSSRPAAQRTPPAPGDPPTPRARDRFPEQQGLRGRELGRDYRTAYAWIGRVMANPEVASAQRRAWSESFKSGGARSSWDAREVHFDVVRIDGAYHVAPFQYGPWGARVWTPIDPPPNAVLTVHTHPFGRWGGEPTVSDGDQWRAEFNTHLPVVAIHGPDRGDWDPYAPESAYDRR